MRRRCSLQSSGEGTCRQCPPRCWSGGRERGLEFSGSSDELNHLWFTASAAPGLGRPGLACVKAGPSCNRPRHLHTSSSPSSLLTALGSVCGTFRKHASKPDSLHNGPIRRDGATSVYYPGFDTAEYRGTMPEPIPAMAELTPTVLPRAIPRPDLGAARIRRTSLSIGMRVCSMCVGDAAARRP